MNQRLGCGNPQEDIKLADFRFKNAVRPILECNGFQQINKRKQVMINHTSKIMILCKSAPTQHSLSDKAIVEISNLRKKFGAGCTFYVHFNRPPIEWTGKPHCVTFMRNFMKIPALTGIVCGIDELVASLPSINDKKIIYKI